MLGTEADTVLMDQLRPTDIIVASGSTHRVLGVPGVENAKYATAAYFEPETIGNKVVLIGGGLINCEIAVSLADEGKDVTIIELLDGTARDANMFIKPTLDELFAQRAESIHVITEATTKSISEKSVTYTNKDGNEFEVPADTVLYAVGSIPNSAVVDELREWPDWESFKIGRAHV